MFSASRISHNFTWSATHRPSESAPSRQRKESGGRLQELQAQPPVVVVWMTGTCSEHVAFLTLGVTLNAKQTASIQLLNLASQRPQCKPEPFLFLRLLAFSFHAKPNTRSHMGTQPHPWHTWCIMKDPLPPFSPSDLLSTLPFSLSHGSCK